VIFNALHPQNVSTSLNNNDMNQTRAREHRTSKEGLSTLELRKVALYHN